MKIFKKRSIFQANNFGGIVLFSVWTILFAGFFVRGAMREDTLFSVMSGVSLFFTLMGVVGVVAISRLMNYVVIDGDRIIFINAINTSRSKEFKISEMSRVVFDTRVTTYVSRYEGRQTNVARYMSFYIAERNIKYSLYMVDKSDYPLITKELNSRGVEVERSSRF